jgi:hypothetical protein
MADIGAVTGEEINKFGLASPRLAKVAAIESEPGA